MAKRNVDAWTRVIDKGDPVDAVVVNASGCGTTVKDYGHLLAREPKYAERAAKIAGMARDVTEFIGSYDLGPPKRWWAPILTSSPAAVARSRFSLTEAESP